MVKHTQTIRRQFADELSMFDHFVILAPKGLRFLVILIYWNFSFMPINIFKFYNFGLIDWCRLDVDILTGKKSKRTFFKCDKKKHYKCFIYQYQIIHKITRITGNLNVTFATKLLKPLNLRHWCLWHSYSKFPVFLSKIVNIN